MHEYVTANPIIIYNYSVPIANVKEKKMFVYVHIHSLLINLSVVFISFSKEPVTPPPSPPQIAGMTPPSTIKLVKKRILY